VVQLQLSRRPQFNKHKLQRGILEGGEKMSKRKTRGKKKKGSLRKEISVKRKKKKKPLY